MRRTVYRCDRCRKDDLQQLHSFDFGKDYLSNHAPEDGSKPKERIIIDLCKDCWDGLKTYLRGAYPTTSLI